MTDLQKILTQFDDPDQFLNAAARLTLRLAIRCDWVEGRLMPTRRIGN